MGLHGQEKQVLAIKKNANDGHNIVICLHQMFDLLAVFGQDWDLVRCVKYGVNILQNSPLWLTLFRALSG